VTSTQARVVEAIRSLTLTRGYPPSQRDIADHLRLRSVSTVSSHVQRLHQMGVITMDAGVARSIRVVTDQSSLL